MAVKEQDKVQKIVSDKSPLQIENGILGAIMLENDTIITVMEHITPEMFSYDANTKIFKTMKYLYENKRAIDKNTVWAEIVRCGLDSTFLTKQHVDMLGEGGGIYRSSLAKSYCMALSDVYGSTKVEETFQKLLNKAKDKNLSIEKGVELAQKELLNLSTLGASDLKLSMLDYNADVLDFILDEKLNNDAIVGLPTGIYDIDNALDGLQEGRVYGLIADSGVGKSKMGKQIALYNGKRNKNVFIASFEMSVEELTLDMACMESNISSSCISNTKDFIQRHVDSGKFKSKDDCLKHVKEKLRAGIEVVRRLPITIFEHEEPNIHNLMTAINKYVLQHDRVDLIIIDGSDLMHDGKDIVNDLRYMYKKFKDMAKKFKCPILVLHQFNNELNNNKDRFPNVFNIAGGRGIRNNCDVIAMLYRPEVYSDLMEEKPELRGVCKFIIDKIRYKARVKEPIDLKFNGIKFSDTMTIEV